MDKIEKIETEALENIRVGDFPGARALFELALRHEMASYRRAWILKSIALTHWHENNRELANSVADEVIHVLDSTRDTSDVGGVLREWHQSFMQDIRKGLQPPSAVVVDAECPRCHGDTAFREYRRHTYGGGEYNCSFCNQAGFLTKAAFAWYCKRQRLKLVLNCVVGLIMFSFAGVLAHVWLSSWPGALLGGGLLLAVVNWALNTLQDMTLPFPHGSFANDLLISPLMKLWRDRHPPPADSGFCGLAEDDY